MTTIPQKMRHPMKTISEETVNNSGDKSGVVLEHYGDIYYKLDKPEEAKKYWRLAKEQKDYSDKLDKKIKDGILYE